MTANKKPFIFFILWLLISLVQAACTLLTSDEGYYWFYSTHLQWGYYDHPPMVALMIKAGYSIFQNELGARLLNVLVTSLNFILLFKLVPERLKQKNYIYLVLLSQPLLNYFSIIIFPDGPLLFFSLLFFLGYKRLLEKNDLLSSLLMGLSVAGMFYSKYHGVLILIFTVLSNFRILSSKWFWLALVIPAVAAIPHVVWQIENGFPSLEYHLSGRASGFTFKYAGEYISQQIPAIGLVFLVATFRYKWKNQFEKTMKYIAIGTLLFFLLSSFRGFVHFHWTSVALFPMALLAFSYYENRKKLLNWLAIPFIVIIFLFRIHIIYPIIPLPQNDLGYYYNRNLWADDIEKLADGKPVLFTQEFREAGLYSFYTHRTAVALFGGNKRKTQYDLWGYEDSLQGKDILVVQKRSFKGGKELRSRLGKTVYYQFWPRFESYYNIPMTVMVQEQASDSLPVTITVKNTREPGLLFQPDPSGSVPVLFYEIRNSNGKSLRTDTLKIFHENDKINAGDSETLEFSIPVQYLEKGKYNIDFGYLFGELPPSFNSMKNKFEVK